MYVFNVLIYICVANIMISYLQGCIVCADWWVANW